jgi:hypothetical protein
MLGPRVEQLGIVTVGLFFVLSDVVLYGSVQPEHRGDVSPHSLVAESHSRVMAAPVS